MKRILASILSVMLLLGFITTANVSAEKGKNTLVNVNIDGKNIDLDKININVNGENIEADVPAVNYKGNTLVPARIVSEQLGAVVEWDDKNDSAIIRTSDKNIVIKEDSSTALVNEKEQNMPNQAVVKLMSTKTSVGRRTMVPVRFIAETLGAEVGWDGTSKTVIIKSNNGNINAPIKPVKPIVPEKPEPKLNKIKSITAKAVDGSKTPQIHIEAENEISYKDVLSKNEIVIDISDSVLEKDINQDVNNDVIKSIKATKGSNKNTKITISLKKSVTHEIVKDKNTLKVNFINNEVNSTNNILGIERQTINGKEAIVIKNARASKNNSFKLSDPERLVVDIRNTNLNNVASKISTDIVKEIRLGQYTGKEYDPTEEVARIVLDISDNYENSKFTTQERGNDLIIFVEGTKKAPVETPPTVTPPSNNTAGKKTIVIDAGHGGKDPGAVANGIREKDVALKVSLKTRDKLEKLGYRVIMTRTGDTYPSISGRAKIANDNKADAFVSIHFNAATPTATGIETLYSNKNWQNKSFSQSIQKELINNTKARDRGLKYRNDLGVLNGTRGISTLVELGFITNAKDAKEIKTDSYLEKCANAIVSGIHNFFSK